jgi:hypothetical protein
VKVNTGMAGSTRHALGDDTNFSKGKKFEMLQIVKKKERGVDKDMALIKYNF